MNKYKVIFRLFNSINLQGKMSLEVYAKDIVEAIEKARGDMDKMGLAGNAFAPRWELKSIQTV